MPGCGARAGSSSSRSRPTSRRISPSAWRPVASIAASDSRAEACSPSSTREAAWAWTTTTLRLWATTSCNSRAMRARSSATASRARRSRSCSSRAARATSALTCIPRSRSAYPRPHAAASKNQAGTVSLSRMPPDARRPMSTAIQPAATAAPSTAARRRRRVRGHRVEGDQGREPALHGALVGAVHRSRVGLDLRLQRHGHDHDDEHQRRAAPPPQERQADEQQKHRVGEARSRDAVLEHGPDPDLVLGGRREEQDEKDVERRSGPSACPIDGAHRPTVPRRIQRASASRRTREAVDHPLGGGADPQRSGRQRHHAAPSVRRHHTDRPRGGPHVTHRALPARRRLRRRRRRRPR